MRFGRDSAVAPRQGDFGGDFLAGGLHAFLIVLLDLVEFFVALDVQRLARAWSRRDRGRWP